MKRKYINGKYYNIIFSKQTGWNEYAYVLTRENVVFSAIYNSEQKYWHQFPKTIKETQITTNLLKEINYRNPQIHQYRIKLMEELLNVMINYDRDRKINHILDNN